MWRFIKYPISLIILGTVLTSCFQSDYTKLVKSELGKGIRKDSILFGINFGETKKVFFDKCLALNHQHLVTEGPNSGSIQYIFEDSVVHKRPTEIKLIFVPTYDGDDKVAEMTLEFTYSGWAPWNRQYQSDSLEVKALKLLKVWYGGNEFITAKISDKDVPIKLDGNRRLLVYKKDEKTVGVKVQDILHPMFKHTM